VDGLLQLVFFIQRSKSRVKRLSKGYW